MVIAVWAQICLPAFLQSLPIPSLWLCENSCLCGKFPALNGACKNAGSSRDLRPRLARFREHVNPYLARSLVIAGACTGRALTVSARPSPSQPRNLQHRSLRELQSVRGLRICPTPLHKFKGSANGKHLNTLTILQGS